jgi:hypothetical protein
VVGSDRPGDARRGECEPDAAVAEILYHSAAIACIIRYNSAAMDGMHYTLQQRCHGWHALYVTTALPWMACIIRYNGAAMDGMHYTLQRRCHGWHALYVTTALPWMACIIRYNSAAMDGMHYTLQRRCHGWHALYVTTALPWMACIIRYNGAAMDGGAASNAQRDATCVHAVVTSSHLAKIVLNLADDHGHGLGRAVLCELRHEHVALAVAFVELFRSLPVGALGAIDVTSGSVSALATDL